MSNKFLKQFLFGLGLFLLGFGVVVVGREIFLRVASPQIESRPLGLNPVNPTIGKPTLITPIEAVPTKLISMAGDVQRIPWDKFDPEPATAGSSLFQGDEILTHKGTATIQIQGVGQFSLSEDTDVQLSSMVQQRVVVRELQGMVQYALGSNTVPLNIVVGRSLFELSTGSMTIGYQDNVANITLVQGKAKLGYHTGANNITRTWALTDGDTVRVSDATEKVVTTGKLLGN